MGLLLDHAGTHPDHRHHPRDPGCGERVRDLHHHQRPPAGADHRPRPHRAVVVRGRAALHQALGRRRGRGHRVHRGRRAASGPATVRAVDHRRRARVDPGVERPDRRADAGTARPDQRQPDHLHRAGRNRPHQQPGGQSRRLVLPVGGVLADAGDDPARRATALSGDVVAGGRRDDRVHADPRTGHPGGRDDDRVRRLRPPLAGPPDPSPRQHRARRRRASPS